MTESGSAVLQQVLFFALLVLGLYVLVLRPQRLRARALAAVRSSLAPGSRVITTAGIHARVQAVEGDVVVLEIAPGVLVRFADAAVVRVLDEPPGAADGPAAADEPR